jgi:hypothetical protein
MSTPESITEEPSILEFEPTTHTYRINGPQGSFAVPSVTELLDSAGLTPDYSIVAPAVLQHARERGLHVDLACDLYDANDLDWRSVHPEALPYLEAWARFREHEEFRPLVGQLPLYHPMYAYAGTADAVGLLPGNRPAIVERKTTAKMAATVALQAAGYGLEGLWYAPPGGGVLAPVPWERPVRLGVQLKRDGSYVLVPYDDPEDYAAFLGVVALGRWRGARRALQPSRRAR